MVKSTYISALIKSGQRFITAKVFGNDARSANECAPFGIDSLPPAKMIAVYSETSTSGAPVVIGYINTAQLVAAVGESRIYATDSNGAEKIRVWLHNDGTMELGGTGASGSNANHAAQYEGLQTAFNQFKSDFNSFITTFNSHVHTGVTTGSGSSGSTVTPGSDTTADITGAKLTTIKTP